MTATTSQLSLLSDSGAVFSAHRTYRYRLWRSFQPGAPRVCFCMLNPSVAAEGEDDPTIRRCLGFARKWGYGGIVVVNLFALVSTDPRVLSRHTDPVGPDNDRVLGQTFAASPTVVMAWGAQPQARTRAPTVMRILAATGHKPMCIGVTRDGSPRHPLFVRGSTDRTEWRPYAD